MPRSKKIFLALASLFILILGYIAFDFSSKTRFPGSVKTAPADSTNTDSLEIKPE